MCTIYGVVYFLCLSTDLVQSFSDCFSFPPSDGDLKCLFNFCISYLTMKLYVVSLKGYSQCSQQVLRARCLVTCQTKHTVICSKSDTHPAVKMYFKWSGCHGYPLNSITEEKSALLWKSDNQWLMSHFYLHYNIHPLSKTSNQTRSHGNARIIYLMSECCAVYNWCNVCQ